MSNQKTLIVLYSYHHNNTEKVAVEMADVLDASIKAPKELQMEDLQPFDLIGFGAGIDSNMHYKELIQFAEKLPLVTFKKCFIFSTSAIQGENKVQKDHKKLRSILQSKGYEVIGEFSCLGFNTNSFLKFFGGMNKQRPNSDDLTNARRFARSLISRIQHDCNTGQEINS